MLPVGIDIASFGYDEYRENLFRLSMGKQIADYFLSAAKGDVFLKNQFFVLHLSPISTSYMIIL
jgi:hypothetical protein